MKVRKLFWIPTLYKAEGLWTVTWLREAIDCLKKKNATYRCRHISLEKKRLIWVLIMDFWSAVIGGAEMLRTVSIHPWKYLFVFGAQNEGLLAVERRCNEVKSVVCPYECFMFVSLCFLKSGYSRTEPTYLKIIAAQCETIVFLYPNYSSWKSEPPHLCLCCYGNPPPHHSQSIFIVAYIFQG